MTFGGGWGEGSVQMPNGEDRLALAVRFWWGEGGSPNRRAAERPGPRRSASEGGTHTRRDSGAHGRSRTGRGGVGGLPTVYSQRLTRALRVRGWRGHTLHFEGLGHRGASRSQRTGESHTHTHTPSAHPGARTAVPERGGFSVAPHPPKTRRARLGRTH